MERILCASLTLFYTTSVSEVFHAAAAESAVQSEVAVPRARLKLYGDTIAKLQLISDDIHQFVATYDRPVPTKEGSTFKYFRKILKKSNTVKYSRVPIQRPRRTSYITPRTYPGMRDRRVSIYNHLVKIFSFNNYTMEETLLSKSNVTNGWKKDNSSPTSQCLNDTYSEFRTRCNYKYFYYGGLKQIRGLLQQTCSVGWMSTKQILHVIQTCCQERFRFSLFQMETNN